MVKMLKTLIKIIVTFISGKREKKESKAERLYKALQEAVKLPQYQAGFNPDGEGVRCYEGTTIPVTYCNTLALDFLDLQAREQWSLGHIIDEYNYDINWISKDLAPWDTIVGTAPQTHWESCIENSKHGKCRLLTMEQAQQKANQGIPIWVVSGKHNHEAIVCADLKREYDPERGCLIGQAGSYNGIFYITDWQAWGANGLDPEILFVQLKPIGGDFE